MMGALAQRRQEGERLWAQEEVWLWMGEGPPLKTVWEMQNRGYGMGAREHHGMLHVPQTSLVISGDSDSPSWSAHFF